MEILSRSFDKAATDGLSGYHPKCIELSLTHLIFADDLVIFSEANEHYLHGIKDIFDTFYL